MCTRIRAERNAILRVSGYIQVADAANSTLAGYLTTELNIFGEYGYTSTNVTEALQVSFSYDPTSPGGIEITAANGLDAAAPLFGFSESPRKIFGERADGGLLVSSCWICIHLWRPCRGELQVR